MNQSHVEEEKSHIVRNIEPAVMMGVIYLRVKWLHFHRLDSKGNSQQQPFGLLNLPKEH